MKYPSIKNKTKFCLYLLLLFICGSNIWANDSSTKLLNDGGTPPVIASTPTVAYIIPDLGTPGMNTYMEIISNTNEFGAYGADRSVQNPYADPTLKIEFKNPDDAKKIDFGPLVVSWGGRMIATQVFVNPYLPMPNSFHWDLLSSDNIIEFRIVSGVNSSEWQKFYLVKPYHFGDLSNNTTDNVFGENNLGKRSPRGCMIVDSLKLNSITYKVSTNDCDPNTPGNQGYLPFVLLSKGNIVGKWNGSVFSKISLDAASAPDAAPGGGGGGGKFCDFTGSGYNGGKGFVGGGPGGYNKAGNPFGGSDSYKDWGESSGLDGNSINGVLKPEKAWYENAGGGTGHPFGISGKGSYVQTPSEANNRGGYGGGSGDNQVTKGGGAGNSTLGIGTNSFNAGKIHGNKLVVPIAGGSGGASGNPQGMNNCSGNGGGGGGAIRIFACDISDLEISAQGANGSSGDGGTDGGGGSGGYVGVFAKYQTVDVKAYVEGGKTGNGGAKNGAGRVRFDIYKPMIGTTSTPNASIVPEANYLGFTTDSTTFVPRKYKIKGTKQMNDVLDLYLKSKSDPNWVLVGTINTNSTAWSQNLNLTGTDSVYYFLATKQIETPGRQDSAQYLPNIDFSQAAANVLRIDKFPEIAGDSVSQIDTYYCEGNIKYDTVKIWNKGKIALNLKLSSAIFKHYSLIAGFDYLPKRDTVLAPNDTLKLVISYTVQPGIKGTVIDTLEIAHNDLSAYHQPWLVECTANIDEFGGEFYDAAKTNKIIELDFGDLCPNSPKTLTASVKNISATDVELDDFVLELGTKFNATITNRTISKDGFVTFDVTYLGHPVSGSSLDQLYLRFKGCPNNLDTLVLKAKVIVPGIGFERTPIDLGIICKGKSSNVKTLEITNQTELPLDLTYTIIPAINGLSFNLTPNSKLEAYGKLTANIGFNANGLADGTYSWKIALNDANCGNFSDTISVSAKVQTTTLKADPTSDFGLVQVGFDKTNAITLKNIGTGVANITSLPIAKAPFEIVSSIPPIPTQIAPNGQITFNVIFKPTAQGTFYDTLRFISLETGTTCSALDSTLLSGSASLPKVLVSPTEIDFGLLATCQKPKEKFTVTNVGTFAVNISKVEITGADKLAFKIISPNANTPLVLSPNISQEYEVEYDASVLPLGIHNAEVVFTAEVIMPKVKLTGENDSVKIIMNPTSPISLGAVPKGNTKTIDIEIKNLSKLLVVINSFTSNNCTITPNSLTLNGGEAKIITVNALVEQTGINNFSIDYAITAPCAGNGLINLQAVGLEGKVVFPDKFPYGLLDPCQTLSKPWTITNTGDADIDLNSASINGTDAALFTIENPITAKITLAPTQSYTLNILFDPTASVDGMKSANLVVKSTMNAQTVDLITQLSGERRAGLLSTPPNLAFNDVRVNASKNLSIELKNNGVQTIIIDSIKLPTQNSIFIVNPQTLNITMPVGGLPTNLNVDFKPTDIRFYEDSLIVYFNVNNCKDSVTIVLSGSGIPATIVTIRLPKLDNIDPKLTQLDIPIYAKLENSDNDVPIKDLSISMQVQLNGTLYIPTNIIPNGHTFTNTINTVGERTITINLNKVEVGKEEKIIGTIQGVPLLGNSIETPLAIKILSYDNLTDVSKIEVEDGSLSYTICQNGDDRLIEYKQPQLMKINQNPPGDFINLEITTLEQGNHSLKIVNTLGEEQIIDNWYSDGKTNNVKKYSVPTVEYSSGTYIIILQGPNKMTTQQLQIIK